MNKEVIVAILLLICLLMGYLAGTYVTIKAVANIAVGFVDEELIRQALYQYETRLGFCYPSVFENASINWNSGE